LYSRFLNRRRLFLTLVLAFSSNLNAPFCSAQSLGYKVSETLDPLPISVAKLGERAEKLGSTVKSRTIGDIVFVRFVGPQTCDSAETCDGAIVRTSVSGFEGSIVSICVGDTIYVSDELVSLGSSVATKITLNSGKRKLGTVLVSDKEIFIQDQLFQNKCTSK
jgi:hypothetical protein